MFGNYIGNNIIIFKITFGLYIESLFIISPILGKFVTNNNLKIFDSIIDP